MTGRAGPSAGNWELVGTLLDYVCTNFYKQQCAGLTTREERCLAMFRELTQRTALLVAKWQGVGWCHGVLVSSTCRWQPLCDMLLALVLICVVVCAVCVCRTRTTCRLRV